MSNTKKFPERKCAACNGRFVKNELFRIASDKEGNVVIDEKGTHPGRGCYICKNKDCVLLAEKQSKIQRSLKRNIPKDIYETLKVML